MNSMWKGSTARAGFSLVEVMVSIVVLSFGALSMVRITGGLAVALRQAGAQTVVVAAAQTGLEATEVRDFASVTTGTTADTVTIQGRAFVRSVTVTAAGARVKRVDVTVSPLVPPGPTHHLTSYVHKRW